MARMNGSAELEDDEIFHRLQKKAESGIRCLLRQIRKINKGSVLSKIVFFASSRNPWIAAKTSFTWSLTQLVN